jgi:hypothetical protein
MNPPPGLELLRRSLPAGGPHGEMSEFFFGLVSGVGGAQLDTVAGVDQADIWVQTGPVHKGREGLPPHSAQSEVVSLSL